MTLEVPGTIRILVGVVAERRPGVTPWAEHAWAAREIAPNTSPAALDLGRNLFAISRDVVTPADRGAMSISCGLPYHDGTWEYDAEYELGDAAHAAEAPHEAKDA